MHRILVTLALTGLLAQGRGFFLGSGGAPFGTVNLARRAGTVVTDSRITLIASNYTYSASYIVHPEPVFSHLGFKSAFGWSTSNCSPNLPIFSTPLRNTDGVQLFLTESSLDSISTRYSNYLMAVGPVSTVFSVGYVASLNEFHVCDWDGYATPDSTAPFFRQMCRVFPNTKARLSCGYHEFEIEYINATNLLSLTVDDRLIFEYTMPRSFRNVSRYLGIAAGTDALPRAQDITFWTWGTEEISSDISQPTSVIQTLNNAYLDQTNGLFLTNSSSLGLGIFPYDLVMLNQKAYNVSFKWSVSGQALSDGADAGFALFFSKTNPALVSDLASTAGNLGIQNRDNVSIIGYHIALNEFYVCSWTVHQSNTLLRNYCPKFRNLFPPITSAKTLSFEILYTQPGVFKISVNGATFSSEMVLNKSETYYVGFSGSSGLSSLTQYISDFSLKFVPDVKYIPAQWTANVTTFAYQSPPLTYLDTTYLDTTTLPPYSLYLNTPTASSTFNRIGGVICNTSFEANKGFNSKFVYQQNRSTSSCNNAGLNEGITFFLTSDPTVLQMRNLSYGDLGVRRLSNVMTITYVHNTTGQVIICKWGGYKYNPTDFRGVSEYCTTMTRSMGACMSGLTTYATEVNYKDDMLTLSLNGLVLTTVPMAIAPSYYYVGIISADQGGSSSYRTLSSWSLQYYQLNTYGNKTDFTFNNDVLALGAASTQSNTVQIANSGVGLVMSKAPFASRFDFSTSFSWRPNFSPTGLGFTFCLTTTPSTNATIGSDVSNAGYGTSELSNLISITYYGATNQFKLYNSVVSVPNKVTVSCIDFTNVIIEYTPSNVLRLYIQGALATSFNATIDPSLYYIGLSSTEGAIERWSYTTSPVNLRQQFDMAVNTSSITTLGTASMVGSSLRLTTASGQSGVGYYPLPIDARLGFNSTLTWTPTNCDANGGADGFTLFLSQSVPSASEVYSSSGGLLGIGSTSNILMMAYSATFNDFYTCNWTTPLTGNFKWLCGTVVPGPAQKLACSNSHIFNYSYDGGALTMQVNGTTVMTSALKLDPVPYFVGVSGATGGGYFQQDVTNWSFNTVIV